MRHVVVWLVIAAILLVGVGLSQNYLLEHSANSISSRINVMEESVSGNRWDEAKNALKKAQIDWTGMRKWWGVLIDHQEIDNIDQSLAKVKEYIRASSKTEALAELAVLKLFLKHIPEKESLRLFNIM